MNKKMIGFIALAIFIIGSGVILLRSNPDDAYKIDQRNMLPVSATLPTSPNPTDGAITVKPVVNPNPKPPVKSGYTLADVAKHNSASSCWTAVYGSVYDVTSWINQHPGGKRAILSMCGTDGTNAFDNQHGGQNRANAELATFKIGALSN